MHLWGDPSHTAVKVPQVRTFLHILAAGLAGKYRRDAGSKTLAAILRKFTEYLHSGTFDAFFEFEIQVKYCKIQATDFLYHKKMQMLLISDL